MIQAVISDRISVQRDLCINPPKKNQQGDNTQDPEAAWNVKTAADGKRKSTYGFKLHANTDEDGYQENDLYAWQCA